MDAMTPIHLTINVPAPIPISTLSIFEKRYVNPGIYPAKSLIGNWVKITIDGENIFLPGLTYQIIAQSAYEHLDILL